MKWTKDSWKNFEAKQMPAYADQANLDSVIAVSYTHLTLPTSR